MTYERRPHLAKYKIATPTGASFTVAGGGYDLEMEPLLLEGLYDIQTEGFGPVSLYIIPSLTPDREENGMGYHIAIN